MIKLKCARCLESLLSLKHFVAVLVILHYPDYLTTVVVACHFWGNVSEPPSSFLFCCPNVPWVLFHEKWLTWCWGTSYPVNTS